MAQCKKIIIAALSCLLITGCAKDQPPPNGIAKLTDSRINSKLAFDLIQKGQLDSAHQKLSLALAEDEENPSSWYIMGYLNEVNGDVKQATADYKKAIALAPRSGPAHNNYGTFLCQQGKFDEALKQFEIAVKEPRYYNISNAYENAGLCALQAGHVRSAKKNFLAALSSNPYLPHSFFELAFIYYSEKDYANSKFYLNKYFALIKNPGSKSKQLRAFLKMKHHPALPQFLPEPVIEQT